MGFPGPGEDTEQTPSHCDTRVSTHRARGRHAPAPEDGGRGTLGRSPRMSEKTCRSVPGVPSRPPGRSTRQAHPRVLARPRPRRSSPEPAAGRAGELDTATGASGAHGGRTEGRTPAPRALRGRVGLGQAPGAPAMCAMRGVGRRRSQSPTVGGFPSSAACCPNWRVVGSTIARLALRSSAGRLQCRARGGAHCDPHPPGSVPSGSRDRPPGGEGRP